MWGWNSHDYRVSMKRTEDDDFSKRYKIFGRNTVRQNPGASATGQKDATNEGNPILQLTHRMILGPKRVLFSSL